MDPFTVPAAILSFLLTLGCTPTAEVYSVDDIQINGVSTPGIYDAAEFIVYIRKDVVDLGVVVHELYHSCQTPAEWGTPQHRKNEAEAHAVEKFWRENR